MWSSMFSHMLNTSSSGTVINTNLDIYSSFLPLIQLNIFSLIENDPRSLQESILRLFDGGGPLWPPPVPRLAARPSQSNPRGSGPEVLKLDLRNLEFPRSGSSGPSSLMWPIRCKTKLLSLCQLMWKQFYRYSISDWSELDVGSRFSFAPNFIFIFTCQIVLSWLQYFVLPFPVDPILTGNDVIHFSFIWGPLY